jgi:glycosyltransferase involved in cell wall biosynthesis
MIATTPFYREKGSSLRIYSIAEALGSEYEIDLVTYAEGEDRAIPNVNIHRTPSFFKPNIGVNKISISKIVLDLFVLLKCLELVSSNEYQIIHCEDFESAFIGRCLVIFNRRKKLVYDLHNRILDNLTLKREVSPSLRKIIALTERIIVKRCDLIILNWRKYAEAAIFREKRTILYYDKIDSHARESYQLPWNTQYLVYSGNFEKYQGIQEFLETYITSYCKFNLVLIGDASDDIRHIIRENKMTDKVILTGRLSIGQTNFLIVNAAAAILPRLKGSTMKLIHYINLGKLIIANDTNSNRELLNPKSAFLYKNNSELKSILGSLHRSQDTSIQLSLGNKIKKVLLDNDSGFLPGYRSAVYAK